MTSNQILELQIGEFYGIEESLKELMTYVDPNIKKPIAIRFSCHMTPKHFYNVAHIVAFVSKYFKIVDIYQVKEVTIKYVNPYEGDLDHNGRAFTGFCPEVDDKWSIRSVKKKLWPIPAPPSWPSKRFGNYNIKPVESISIEDSKSLTSIEETD